MPIIRDTDLPEEADTAATSDRSIAGSNYGDGLPLVPPDPLMRDAWRGLEMERDSLPPDADFAKTVAASSKTPVNKSGKP